MQPVTIRIPDDTHSTLSEEADESGRSMSEIGREYIERGMDYDELQRENERLRAEKRTLITDREERTELVEYVEEERSWRSAGLGTRVKWWVFGKDE